MADVAFVACSKSKADHTRPAATLYTSPLYRKSLLHALTNSKRVFILSAKHGVVPLDRRLEPYEKTLKTNSVAETAHWATMVESQVSTILKSGMNLSVYAGADYSKPLTQIFLKSRCRVEYPLQKLSLGRRLALLSRLNDEARLRNQIKEFYRVMLRLLSEQHGGRQLRDATGRSGWPDRGLYLFLERHERGFNRVPRVFVCACIGVDGLWGRSCGGRDGIDPTGAQ